jgi:hypothetical protein
MSRNVRAALRFSPTPIYFSITAALSSYKLIAACLSEIKRCALDREKKESWVMSDSSAICSQQAANFKAIEKAITTVLVHAVKGKTPGSDFSDSTFYQVSPGSGFRF